MQGTFLLLDDIRDELKKALEQMPFRAPGKPESYRVPSVCIGHIPPKQSRPTGAEVESGTDAEPPFVLITSTDGEIKFDSNRARVHEAKVAILCCTYSEESFKDVEAGYHDIMNLMDTVMLALYGKQFWANNHWTLQLPLVWSTGLGKAMSIYDIGGQFHPHYGAAIMATFTAAGPAAPSVPGTDINF